jgi:hypothetical protein
MGTASASNRMRTFVVYFEKWNAETDEEFMRFGLVAVVVALAATMEANALVIDSFDAGALVRGSEATELDLPQV